MMERLVATAPSPTRLRRAFLLRALPFCVFCRYNNADNVSTLLNDHLTTHPEGSLC